MSAVRSSNNRSTERRFRALVVQRGFIGWHLHDRSLPGCPDFVFQQRQLAIFIDGCFWHGCPTCYRRPASRRAYWDKKVRANVARDKRTNEVLKLRGWRSIRFWEHDVKEAPERCLEIVTSELHGQRTSVDQTNPTLQMRMFSHRKASDFAIRGLLRQDARLLVEP